MAEQPHLDTSSAARTKDAIQEQIESSYRQGFESPIESDVIPIGLSEETIRLISQKKKEPEFLLAYRLKAYRHFLTLTPPSWSAMDFKPIDLQSISYFAAPKSAENQPGSLDEVDPKLLEVYQRLGVPLHEQKLLAGVAVDAVFDSVSVATTFKEELSKQGIIFCSFSEAARNHPKLVEAYLGKVVPYTDNYYAALNAAVFSDGSFCYIPKGVRCPMDLSTYFRINAKGTGQFERTLIIAEPGSYVSYLEGCTAPIRDENQLHAAVVEIFADEDAEVHYSTVQNWYSGDEMGKGGIYNLVTKRGLCSGDRARISWTQVEVGSAVTWKYPSVVLKGNQSRGDFYSVAITKGKMQADTGTKMIHLGEGTKSSIVAKGIAAGESKSVYRGLVKSTPSAKQASNYSQCDSLLIGNLASVYTYPYLDLQCADSQVEHEATNTKISEEQLYYAQVKGIPTKEATSLIISGFCKEVFDHLPMEFAVEIKALLELTLEDSIG